MYEYVPTSDDVQRQLDNPFCSWFVDKFGPTGRNHVPVRDEV